MATSVTVLQWNARTNRSQTWMVGPVMSAIRSRDSALLFGVDDIAGMAVQLQFETLTVLVQPLGFVAAVMG